METDRNRSTGDLPQRTTGDLYRTPDRSYSMLLPLLIAIAIAIVAAFMFIPRSPDVVPARTTTQERTTPAPSVPSTSPATPVVPKQP